MKWLKGTLYTLMVLLLLATGTVYSLLHLSLATYDGVLPAAVTKTTQLSRDAQGYLSIRAASREDAAYALGFAHAQERFFQMDLYRRNAAGELSELFGKRALEVDKSRRLHRFRDRAEIAFKALPKPHQQLLQRYTAGVNAGLAQLAVPPFEYLLLTQKPRIWHESDSLLVTYSMYLDLQPSDGKDDLAQGFLKQTVSADWYAFLNQHSSDWQAAIDGSTVTAIPLPETPYPRALSNQKVACNQCLMRDGRDIGSNNFAVSGALTQHGGAILADDMHLGIRVPGTWYKAQMIWGEGEDQHSVAGVSLPGAPAIVAGSNGHIAWGYTNSTADWSDVVALNIDEKGLHYATSTGPAEFSYNNEVIKVKDAADEIMLIKETKFGPVLPAPFDKYAFRWVAHDKEGMNLNLIGFETAKSVDEAVAIAPTLGIPTQNLLVADSKGKIAWTLAGALPNRQLQDLDTPQDWSTDDNRWSGYLTGSSYPKVVAPAGNRLWTANARVVGGDALKLIGDGGYDIGARGMQIRDGLLAKAQHDEQSLHAIQLDHRALFLQRWQQLLLQVLDPVFVEKHQLANYRKLVETDSASASKDAVGYHLVRAFRDQTLKQLFSPLSALLEQQQLSMSDLKMVPENPGWAMLQAKRIDTLPEGFTSFEQFLQEAVLASKQQLETDSKGPIEQARWGKANTAAIVHPLASAIPMFADYLNMPADELNGDRHMPRVQHKVHGQSERMVVAPGHETQGILVIPAGQSGHPLSPFYRADHQFWLQEKPLSFLPGEQKYRLELQPQG